MEWATTEGMSSTNAEDCKYELARWFDKFNDFFFKPAFGKVAPDSVKSIWMELAKDETFLNDLKI